MVHVAIAGSPLSSSSGIAWPAAASRRTERLPVLENSDHAGEPDQQERMQAELVEPDHVAVPHRVELFLGHSVVFPEIFGVVVELLGEYPVADHIARDDVQ